MEKRIAVFDDNDNRRDGLQMLISFTDGLMCCGCFPDCSNVLHDIETSKPDVVLMDIDMPKVNGIEGVKIIRKKYPQLKILMQTVFEDDDKIFASICAGADGYILKKAPPHELVKAINEVLDGGAPMTPSIARQVLRLVNNQANKNLPSTDFKLTTREHEILSFLVQGLSYKMISQRCFISMPTVNSHIQNIYEKLQVHSVVEAVTKAIENRIV
ncbi:MAG TPA: response regulator transcription factor [Chitinophagaceae bacterium]|nr:response regulator transcription factor [Chitinophagaceae bacterium]